MRKLLDGMKYGFVSLPRDIGKPLLIGLAIAAWKSACKRDPRREEKIGIEKGPTVAISVG